MIAATSISTRAQRRCEGADLDERARRAHGFKGFRAGARHALRVRHVDHVHHGTDDMPHAGASLSQDVGDQCQCGPGLQVGVAVEVRRTRSCAGDKDLASDAHGTGVAIGILKRIPR
jgi:hypothetical protein